VPLVNCVKLPGVTFDSHLNFDQHTSNASDTLSLIDSVKFAMFNVMLIISVLLTCLALSFFVF